MPATTSNQKLKDWVDDWAAILQPDEVDWCDGSRGGVRPPDASCWSTAAPSPGSTTTKRPNSYLALSDPGDVARVEDRTFICSEREIDAGPTNNWRAPAEMKAELLELYTGAMKGRTMYVVPFSMGPLGSPIAHIGVQLTDSAYVAVNMRIMTRMGQAALDVLGADGEFVPCVHSVGYPLVLADGTTGPTCRGRATPRTSTSPTSPRPARSGATARATAATPCSARSASPCASPRPWPATTAGWPSTCSILGITAPTGEKTYVAAAFPSACGKTNMAMLIPTLPGWKVETIGDDIAWMKFGDDGRLYAINPEAGLLRRRPGHRRGHQPQRHALASRPTRSSPTSPRPTTATCGGRACRAPPAHLIDWKGNDWTPASDAPAAHPNARFTAPASQCPSIAPEWEDPNGVPISAILFGGRRATNVPLVTEASTGSTACSSARS